MPEPHPWRGIDLDVYERHMSDPRVGQLPRLHTITAEQVGSYPGRAISILGVAGGNGLDAIDPLAVDTVHGYDINPDYLAACETRYRPRFGERLHLVEATVDRTLILEPADLVIANLIIEYVGVAEFAAFASVNAPVIGTLSCVIQSSDAQNFVSATPYSASFDGLASVSSDVDPRALTSAMAEAGFQLLHISEHPWPDGKTLVRLDFQPITR